MPWLPHPHFAHAGALDAARTRMLATTIRCFCIVVPLNFGASPYRAGGQELQCAAISFARSAHAAARKTGLQCWPDATAGQCRGRDAIVVADLDITVGNDGAGCRHWTPPCGAPAHVFPDPEKWCSAGSCHRYSRNGTAKPDTTRLINPGLPPLTVVLSVSDRPPPEIGAPFAEPLPKAYPASPGPRICSSRAAACPRAAANRS
jgi:hypothetical protein